MQYSKIALACGLALSAIAAQAAGPTIPAGTVTIFLSGATAPDNFLNDTIKDMLTNEVAIRGSSNANGYRAFLGQATANIPGVTAGTNILLIKRSKGGSVWGVDPVARAQRVEVLDFNNCTSVTPTASDPYSWACGVKGTDPGTSGYVNTAANAGLIPDFGVSDVEPALFKTPYNTENGLPQLTATELARLTASPVNQIMMGIVATDAVSASTHISRSQYGAMLAGKMQTWKEIDGTDDNVVVCRRVPGSGTQTSYNWFFTGFPCNSAVNGFTQTPPAEVADSAGFDDAPAGTAADPYIIDPSAGYTVIENSGSGDVRNCLKAAQNGTDHTVTGSNGKVYKVLFSAVGGPSKAIGVLSLDSYVQAAAAGSGFSFRMLDGAGTFNGSTQTASVGATGIAPSKANLVNGKYDFVVELSMQRRNQAVNLGTETIPAPDATKTAFFTQLVKNLGSVKYTGNVGGTFTSTPNAFATLPTVASYTAPANTGLVNRYSRGANTCSPLVGRPSL